MERPRYNGTIPRSNNTSVVACLLKRQNKKIVTEENEPTFADNNNVAEHIDDNTCYSSDTEYACICFGTHTGRSGDGVYVEDGTHASSKEATDNSTDEPKT